MSDIQKNLQNLYEYNVVLREKLLAIYSSSSGNNGAVSDETKPRIENLQTISREVRQWSQFHVDWCLVEFRKSSLVEFLWEMVC